MTEEPESEELKIVSALQLLMEAGGWEDFYLATTRIFNPRGYYLIEISQWDHVNVQVGELQRRLSEQEALARDWRAKHNAEKELRQATERDLQRALTKGPGSQKVWR